MALKSTKLFILKLSKSNYAIYILCFIAYIEAIFFTIPPDLLLIPLSIINYRKVLYLAFLTTFFSVLGGIFGKRAQGGPVSAGRSYVVGERGPEIFTPRGSGNITANNKLGGSVNINVNVDAGGTDVEGSDTKGYELGQQIAIAIQSEIIPSCNNSHRFNPIVPTWRLPEKCCTRAFLDSDVAASPFASTASLNLY